MANPNATLEQTLIECTPFKDGAASLVCVGCFNLLAYPFGAKKIKCGFCSTVTDGIKIRCTACQQAMRVPLNVTSVRCTACKYNFKPQATLRIKPPSWARAVNGQPLEMVLRVVVDNSVGRATCREKVVKVVPNQPFRSSTTTWEDDFGADFRSIGFFRDGVQIDTSQTPMGLQLQNGDTVEIHRVDAKGNTGHQFIECQFGTPTNCAYCKEFIWGIYHQGRKCTKCKLPVHHRCAEKTTTMCEADRRALFGIVNFDCDDDEADSSEPVVAVVVREEDKVKFASCVTEQVEPECDKNFMASLSKLSHFTDQEIMDMWTNYDADASGTLERDEIKKLMSDMIGAGGGKWKKDDPTVEDAVDRMIQRMDQNHDGVISWEEFWYFYKAQQDSHFLEQFKGIKLTNEQIYELWYHYDTDSSGTLDADEMLQLLGDLSAQKGTVIDKNKGKFESLLGPNAKISWETFYTTVVPIIRDSLT